jgi:hypothetical protein
LTYPKIEPTLKDMTKTLTALVAAVTLATATTAVPTTADAHCVGCAEDARQTAEHVRILQGRSLAAKE